LRIEVPPTAFPTETVTITIALSPLTLTLTSDLDLQSQESYGQVITHTRAKGRGQKSLGSKVKSGNRLTDGGDCIRPTCRANAVDRNALASTICIAVGLI